MAQMQRELFTLHLRAQQRRVAQQHTMTMI